MRQTSHAMTRIILAGVLLLTACNSDARLRQAHEIAAIQQLKAIGAAEVTYYAQFGHFGGTFGELNIPVPEGSSGYAYKIEASPAGFAVHANPTEFGKTGARCFYTDKTMVIRQSTTQDPADAGSPEVQ
jgi:hypothetical protein